MKAPLTFRRATRADLDSLVFMLADDPLGAKREVYANPLPESYVTAFEAIDKDPNNELIVVCAKDKVVGMMQLTFIPSLTYQGGLRAMIEGVRIDQAVRSQGLGHELIQHAIDRAKARGCNLLQLTTDKGRPQAKLFYERLGFAPSHEGMKLTLR
jgi:GNAT superfamily N-acetyltransferase